MGFEEVGATVVTVIVGEAFFMKGLEAPVLA